MSALDIAGVDQDVRTDARPTSAMFAAAVRSSVCLGQRPRVWGILSSEALSLFPDSSHVSDIVPTVELQ